jgi:hypothetical protein
MEFIFPSGNTSIESCEGVFLQSLREQMRVFHAYKVSVGKSEGKRPQGRLRDRCEDNNKLDIKRIRLCDIDCIDLVPCKDQWQALVSMITSLPRSVKHQEILERLNRVWLLKEWFPWS